MGAVPTLSRPAIGGPATGAGQSFPIFHVNLAGALLNYEQAKNRNLLRPDLAVVRHRKAADVGGIEALG